MISIMEKRHLSAVDIQAAENLNRIWKKRRSERTPNGKRKYTQESVAHEANITQGLFSSYLNKKLPMGTDIILRLAAILHVNPEEIRPNFYQIKEKHSEYKLDNFLLSNSLKAVQNYARTHNKPLTDEQISEHASYIYSVLADYDGIITEKLINLVVKLTLE